MNTIQNPSPHDWPEDWADPAEDNGCYNHICAQCRTQFLGHKRRPNVCKVCAVEHDAEMKRRAEFLSAHGAPMEWAILTEEEICRVYTESVRLIVSLREERALRRKLAAALKVADSTNSNVAYWGHPGRHRDTSEALLAESAKLDESLENRKKEA